MIAICAIDRSRALLIRAFIRGRAGVRRCAFGAIRRGRTRSRCSGARLRTRRRDACGAARPFAVDRHAGNGRHAPADHRRFRPIPNSPTRSWRRSSRTNARTSRGATIFSATVESIAGCALWFHPLVWIARRVLDAAREEACDAVVLAIGRRQHLRHRPRQSLRRRNRAACRRHLLHRQQHDPRKDERHHAIRNTPSPPPPRRNRDRVIALIARGHDRQRRCARAAALRRRTSASATTKSSVTATASRHRTLRLQRHRPQSRRLATSSWQRRGFANQARRNGPRRSEHVGAGNESFA